MNVAVVYCYPTILPKIHRPMADKFCHTWRRFPARYPLTLHVMANGREPGQTELAQFDGLGARWHTYSNLGWDIGAYQWAAEHIDCDLMVCLGAHICFNHGGWLDNMVRAYLQHGAGLYGAWGERYPNWHIRTTAFWCPPQLIQSYPEVVGSDRRSRYMFEHGSRSLTALTLSVGLPAVMVTMRGCFPHPDWPNNTPSSEDSILLDKQHQ